MDFMKALTYPFDDDEWLSKVGLGVLIQLIPVVGSFTLQGWSFEIAKRVKGDDPTPLPDWSDFGDMLVKGLMLAIAGLIYMAPVVVFGCLLWITTLVLGGAVFAADSSQTAGAAGWAFPLLSGCCGCLALIYMIVAVLVYLGGYLR
jgi:hypothetical protein